MYAFQEVHEHFVENGYKQSRSHWRVIHEDSGYWTKYIALGSPPIPMGEVLDDWVFNEWASLTNEERLKSMTTGKKLPVLKINNIDMCPQPSMALTKPCCVVTTTTPTLTYKTPYFSFGDCKPAPTPPAASYYDELERYIRPKQEQGNNPMRDYDYASAKVTSANVATATIVQAPSTETQDQRSYLLRRFEELTRYEWNDPRFSEMTEMFNLNAPKFPKTSQELLDAFKNGKFTVDQKKVDSNTAYYADREIDDEDFDGDYMPGSYAQFFGVTFTDLPVADRKGYEAALAAYRKLKQETKDLIMIGTPAEGLAALRAFELWSPSATAPTTTTVQ